MRLELFVNHALKLGFFCLPAATLGCWRLAMSMKTVANAAAPAVAQRLLSVCGYDGRCNDVIYNRCQTSSKITSRVVFFGGDVQDFSENMLAHRDNRRHVKWNLEATSTILAHSFPESDIFVIRPSRMYLHTFSCYDNFVESNLTGVPTHSPSHNAHQHLMELLQNAARMVEKVGDMTTGSTDCPNLSAATDNMPLILIGFSKGCVVLNQLVHEMHHLVETKEIKDFIAKVKSMCWLDCGHAGGSNVWITDSQLLESLTNTGIDLHVHVTPYQIEDVQRPWIRKEEKMFTERLKKMKANITRQLHFEGEVPSIEIHFQILKEFHKLP